MPRAGASLRSCWLRKERRRKAGKTKAPKHTAKAWTRLREVGPILCTPPCSAIFLASVSQPMLAPATTTMPTSIVAKTLSATSASSMPAPPTEVDEYMPNMVAKTAVARSLRANCVEAASASVSIRVRRRRKRPRKSSTPKRMKGETQRRKAAVHSGMPSTSTRPAGSNSVVLHCAAFEKWSRLENQNRRSPLIAPYSQSTHTSRQTNAANRNAHPSTHEAPAAELRRRAVMRRERPVSGRVKMKRVSGKYG
mmetsp:Transcript_4751/g.11782  ORF Transcript_4751/g.11782 Transcript_4751/m.11782 type:complete len:252 (-) Transcript_4751:376-1131(-)